MNLTFLFWNINKNKNLLEIVARLTKKHRADILVLAESALLVQDVLRTLNPPGERATYFNAPVVSAHRELFQIFCRFSSASLEPLPKQEDTRFSIRRLTLANYEETLLVIAHLVDPRSWDRADRNNYCSEVGRRIREAEQYVGHRRTILFGDLNLHPFDDGIVSALGLHATRSRRIALQRERIVLNEAYPYFYNPMWRFLAERDDAPLGTIFYRSNDPITHFWNVFDQILVRPDLLPYFEEENLRILTTDGVISFLNASGTPDEERVSDHLPILFQLGLIESSF